MQMRYVSLRPGMHKSTGFISGQLWSFQIVILAIKPSTAEKKYQENKITINEVPY